MPDITIAPREVQYACPEDDTILRAALRSGLGFPYECNVGACGNCRFELISGAVAHKREAPPAWSERDRKRNRYLGCQARPLGDCLINVRLEDRYKSRHRPQRGAAELRETLDVTHDIREFRFALKEPAPFLPGQYALLYIPGVIGARAYSMCNVSDDGAEWHFQIKRVPNGSGTTRLFDDFRPGGGLLDVDGPYGMAYLREDSPRDVLCLAGGSGLSPMIAITRAAAASPALAGRQIHFVYGGRGARDICGEPMLRELPGFGQRIHYYPCVSRPESDPAAMWEGRCGLIHDVTREIFGGRLRDFEIYFAGPPAMAKAVLTMLHERNVPPEQLHFDQFY
jgi:toluene monooxygenase electron transfer component